MTEWAQSLKRDREYDSDEMIGHLVTLRQIDDQVQDTLFAGEATHTPLTDTRTLMHMRFMEAQLEAWKKDSTDVKSRRCVSLKRAVRLVLS